MWGFVAIGGNSSDTAVRIGRVGEWEAELRQLCEKNHELPLTILRPFPKYNRITRFAPVEKSPPPAEQFRSLGLIYQLVSEFLAPIVIGLFVDWLAGSAPWFTIVGVLLGVFIGGIRVYRIAGKIGNKGTK